MRTIAAAAALLALVLSVSSIHAQTGIRLELEQVSSDTKNMSMPDRWKVDSNQLTAMFSPPWGQATYRVEMPRLIDAAGAQGRLSINGRAAATSRFSAQLGFLGEVEPQSQVTLQIVMEPGQSKSQTLPLTLKPRANYSEGYSPVMQVRVDGGPVFYFKYRVVRGGSVASTQSGSAPAGLCATPGVYLERIATSRDVSYLAYGAEKWTHDLAAGTATFNPPSGQARYKVEMPAVISPEGAEARMAIDMTAARASRFAAQIGFLGEVEPQSQVTLHLVAEPGETKADTKTFVLKTRENYSDGYEPQLLMRIDGGPTFYYKYRVVRCPKRG